MAKLNPHKFIITAIGSALVALAVAYHVVEDGGPYPPIVYAFNFPWQATILLLIGVYAILAAKGLPTRK